MNNNTINEKEIPTTDIQAAAESMSLHKIQVDKNTQIHNKSLAAILDQPISSEIASDESPEHTNNTKTLEYPDETNAVTDKKTKEKQKVKITDNNISKTTKTHTTGRLVI